MTIEGSVSSVDGESYTTIGSNSPSEVLEFLEKYDNHEGTAISLIIRIWGAEVYDTLLYLQRKEN